jgi:hypothetical protein
MTLKGRVKSGRLIVDERINLPEGTEVELESDMAQIKTPVWILAFFLAL